MTYGSEKTLRDASPKYFFAAIYSFLYMNFTMLLFTVDFFYKIKLIGVRF